MGQGCPLSSLLIILVVEILATKIRNKTEIGYREHKILQFDSIAALLCTIQVFTKYSGLRLNIDNTCLIWLGPWRTKNTNKINFKVETGSFNVVGFHLERNFAESNEASYEDKIEKNEKSSLVCGLQETYPLLEKY